MAVEILIKNKTLTRTLEEIGDAFRALCPNDYEDFIAHVKEEAKHLIKPSGMSAEGALMNFMKIPCGTNSRGEKINLYSFIKYIMRLHHGIDDFFRDRENYELLVKVWSDSYIKKKLTNSGGTT